MGTWAILFAERGPFESQVIDLVRFLVYLGLVLPKRVTYLGERVVSGQTLHQLLVGHCFLDLLVLCLALCSLLVSASVAHDVEDDFDDEAEVEVEAEDTVVVEKVTIK